MILSELFPCLGLLLFNYIENCGFVTLMCGLNNSKFLFRYASLLYFQPSGILSEARLVPSKNVTCHPGRGQCCGIGWLHFHGYRHFTQA